MLSFIFLNEQDFFDPQTSINLDGDKEASLFNTSGGNNFIPYKNSEQVSEFIPDKKIPANFNGPVQGKWDTYNTPSYAMTKDRFGNDVIARQTGDGGPISYQKVEDYMKDKGIKELPQDMANARALADERTTLLDRAKYAGNRLANWGYNNPVATAALLGSGAYVAMQNRDRMKNAMQNFLPNRNPQPGY